MKIFNTLALLLPLALAACGGVTFDQHLRQLEGHPVNDADIMLGHPHTGEYRDGDSVVYVWQDQKVESLFGPAVTNGGYRIGSPSAAMGGDALVWSGIQFDSCVVRVRTLDNVVQHVTFEGNPGGCEAIYGWRPHKLGEDPSSGRLSR